MAVHSTRVADRLRDHFSSLGDDLLVAVYLYGSFARGTAREDSDVDVGLLFRDPPAASISGPAARIEGELEDLLGRRVQAVVLNRAPPDLVHRVLRDGELLFEADRSSRIRFEVSARREYFDLLPTLRRYRRSETPGR